MDCITLGRSGLEVSRICFGTWQFGGEWGSVEEREATAAIQRGLELGITFFDTAHAYGWGASEELLSRALGVRRNDVVLATKGGLRVDDERGLVRDSSPAWIREGVERSLRALDVERIDLYQVHWPDPDVPFAETAGALQELVDEGKIAHVGVSNFSGEQMAEFERTRPVETSQPPYHLFRRDAERDVLPWCREHDVGVLAYGPLAHGLLSGHMSENVSFAEGDWRAGSSVFRGDAFRRNLEMVRELERYAREELDCSVAELALAWVLAQPGVHCAIVGVRRPDHIEGAAPAVDVRLDDVQLRRIDDIMAGAVAVGGPSPEDR